MSEESKREEIKDETHHIQDEEQEELDEVEEEEEEEVGGAEWEEGYSNNSTNISLNLSSKKYIVYGCLHLLYHPFINPIVNPADILPVRGNAKARHC